MKAHFPLLMACVALPCSGVAAKSKPTPAPERHAQHEDADAHSEAESLVTRDLRTPPGFLAAFAARGGVEIDDATQAGHVHNYLVANGVNFPKDAAVIVNDEGTRLTVHSTEEQIERIKVILSTLIEPAVLGPDVPKVIRNGTAVEGAELQKKLQRIIVPEVVLKNVSLREAAKTLGELSVRYDDSGPHETRGVNILVEGESQPAPPSPPGIPGIPGSEPPPTDNPPEAKISYSATKISIADALDAVARLAHHSVTLRDANVYFTESPHPTLLTREYRVSPQLIDEWNSHTGKKNPGKSPADPESQPTNRWLVGGGVTEAPEKSVIYVVKTNRLIVRDSPERQQEIEEIILQGWREYYASDAWKKPQADRKRPKHPAATPDQVKIARESIARIQKKLERIVIPKLSFREATFREAFDFLKKKSVELDNPSPPERQGLRIERAPENPPSIDAPGIGAITPFVGFDPAFAALPAATADARITLSLTNIPAGEALRYVAGLAHAKFRVRPGRVQIVPLSDPDPMFAQDVQIPRGFVAALEKQRREKAADGAVSTDQEIRAYLIANGALFPPGSELILNDARTRLTVYSTKDQLGLIQAIYASAEWKKRKSPK